MNTRDQLRQNIRDIREDRGMTQSEMAEKLNMSETGYAKIERGESGVRVERLWQIAQVLGVNLTDLLPVHSDGGIVFNNSSENFSNSSNFSVALGNTALEAEITVLREQLALKDEVINSREREILLLQKQIATLEKLLAALEK